MAIKDTDRKARANYKKKVEELRVELYPTDEDIKKRIEERVAAGEKKASYVKRLIREDIVKGKKDGYSIEHVIFDEAPSRELLLDRAVHILNEVHPLAPEPEHILTLTVEDHAALHAGKDYTPTCPRGYVDCVHDPAYIKHHHPDWYAKLYGDKTPEEAAHEENGCFDRATEDPDEEYYCYDDEDK